MSTTGSTIYLSHTRESKKQRISENPGNAGGVAKIRSQLRWNSLLVLDSSNPAIVDKCVEKKVVVTKKAVGSTVCSLPQAL